MEQTPPLHAELQPVKNDNIPPVKQYPACTNRLKAVTYKKRSESVVEISNSKILIDESDELNDIQPVFLRCAHDLFV